METTTTCRGSARRLAMRIAAACVLVSLSVFALTACSGGDDDASVPDGTIDEPTENVVGGVGSPVSVGNAVITVKSLQAAFQPVSPAQRLSDEALVAPAAGITFYQAYVHIENRGQFPLRVDPEDFVCQIGNVLSTIEPTRSGPQARSIIYGTSLDLLLTFRGATGAEPTLVYNPPWYPTLITFNASVPSQGGSGGTAPEDATTTSELEVID
jgi:hypothetical protein